MNRQDIEHMWKVATNDPNHDTNWHDPVVSRFADLVASAEREACANLCKELAPSNKTMTAYKVLHEASKAIQSRGQE